MRRLMIIAVLFVLSVMVGCGQSPQASPEFKDEPANSTLNQNLENQQGKVNSEEKDKDSDSSLNKNEKGILPTSISIPSIDVEANVIKVGKLPGGQMESPKTEVDVGWYESGAKPGEKGSAVLAGHVDSTEGPAVFFNLENMNKDDLFYITDEKGKRLTFKVYEKKSYPKDRAPLSKVFGYTAAKTVKLITCTGEFLDDIGTHENRLVVSGLLVEQ
ncbi:class F sortase (plasmid) [Alkalihalobacillus hwajinpoensis]|uniref:class F sortase n=1 Tax=Guptibacillus hwajinpoensis TaxID=208199 RepID=UPI001883D8FE|nr:class F sortase [Pseudalkalibacillus hwajinpoensis]MBF0706551.1 class F sortase [Pseudalkalibacillus hwajinpoensis]